MPNIQRRGPTQEEIDLLSPDSIDNNAFWRVAEELFQTDPVSNCQYTTPVSIDEANARNMTIYHVDGFTGLIEQAGHLWNPKKTLTLPVLEIGPGYGAFKHWLSGRPGWEYHAADCYPRIPGVEATELTGHLSCQTLGRMYAIVLASNVFQHLSVDQRAQYYRDISRCLMPQGRFMVSMMLDGDTMHPGHRCANHHFWCRHYGQLTQIQTEREMATDIQRYFKVEQRTMRADWIVYTCSRRD